MNNIDIAWLAGLIEGEGCFTHSKTRNGPGGKEYLYPFLKVSMTDLDVLERAQRVSGMGKISVKNTNPAHKTQWTWMVRSEEAKTLIKAILPFMSKRRIARINELWP